MNKNISIAFFTDNFYPGTGGTENVIKILATTLASEGDRVKIYCPNYHKQKQNDINLPIYRIPSIKLNDSDHIALPYLVKKKLEKDLKAFNPDIIYFLTASGMAKWALIMGKNLACLLLPPYTQNSKRHGMTPVKAT